MAEHKDNATFLFGPCFDLIHIDGLEVFEHIGFGSTVRPNDFGKDIHQMVVVAFLYHFALLVRLIGKTESQVLADNLLAVAEDVVDKRVREDVTDEIQQPERQET